MENTCIVCKKTIEGKPWISIECDKGCVIHGCSYICNNRIGIYRGNNYRVINKEDFNYLFPIVDSKKPLKIDSYIRENLLQEIEDEERRMKLLEEEYELEYQQSSSESDDWENME